MGNGREEGRRGKSEEKRGGRGDKEGCMKWRDEEIGLRKEEELRWRREERVSVVGCQQEECSSSRLGHLESPT